jgi:hypothetical protein
MIPFRYERRNGGKVSARFCRKACQERIQVLQSKGSVVASGFHKIMLVKHYDIEPAV